MKRITYLGFILAFTGGLAPWTLCKAEDGTVTGDTRYKFTENDKASAKAKVVQTAHTPKVRRVHLRRWHWRTRSYYLHASELPWWPNAPGD
jgi:hypothetical protein